MLFKYTPASDEWNLECTFPGLPRGYAGEFSIGHDIYICGGSQTTTALPIVQGHTPMQNDLWKLAFIIDSLPLIIRDPNTEMCTETKVKLFPNLSSDYLNINFEALNSLERIRIYDALGKQADELILTDEKESLDISKLSAGTYYVQLVTKTNQLLASKFVKE